MSLTDGHTLTLSGGSGSYLVGTVSGTTHGTVLLVGLILVGSIRTGITSISRSIGTVSRTASDCKNQNKYKNIILLSNSIPQDQNTQFKIKHF